ncbi:phosphatidate phosphatase LPIN3 [Striga asiatica]|uniref:phosphatidate phosphatase n=1 Tax=Striga asiatica TaxID=4170 RepID=A0A5A7QGC0_STRAF|nr:phosphatidate phosphatase LPIN3 [Striga asiatica]
MNVVGKVGSFITQGVYSVATPFHPFGGAVDIIVVKQNDGSYRSTPWYVRFGKFQGVLKGAEKLVRIEVNGVEADFHMHLDNSGEAYFVREVDSDGEKDDNTPNGSKENEFPDQKSMDRLERVESDAERIFYEFQDEQSSLEGSVEFSEYGSSRYENLESVESALESQDSSSEVVLVSVDGHILTAPISSAKNAENVQIGTPQFHLGPGEEYNSVDESWKDDYLNGFDASNCDVSDKNVISEGNKEKEEVCVEESGSERTRRGLNRREVFKSCLELPELIVSADDDHEEKKNDENEVINLEISRENDENEAGVSLRELKVEDVINHEENISDTDRDGSVQFPTVDCELPKEVEIDPTLKKTRSELKSPDSGLCSKNESVELSAESSIEHSKVDASTGLELSLCGKLLRPGMGLAAAREVFHSNRVLCEEFKLSASSIVKNEDLIVRLKDDKYLPWEKASHIVLGMAAFGLELSVDPNDAIPVEKESSEAKENESGVSNTPQSRRWRLWPIPFRRVKTLEHSGSGSSNEDAFVDTGSFSSGPTDVATPRAQDRARSPRKQIVRTNVPTTDQIASMNLREGQNMVNFIFSTRVLGCQKVEAHIYLWKWNTRIVISDVDGTITKSDVLGQFMPLVGKDWTHSGIAHLFSAIKENGYQLLFLSARAIVQAYLTKSFLFNLKQDGKSLPNGPVVISPDGLFPSLYREVIRRAPHEFKIACLEDIKALFPPDYNPFYAGFGNRDTDELSYRKIGIPKGKIFIINPKGEVAINHRIDVKSYTSLHTLVNDMFPPTSLVEQEDYNSWNYWKMPLPDIDNM